MKARLLTLALLLASAPGVFAQDGDASAADPFPATFDRVVELVDAEELSGMEVAKGTYHATRLFATGERGLPYSVQRFLAAQKESEAAVSGLYMTVYGKEPHLKKILKELETNAQKRTWLRQEVGSERAFFSSLEAGDFWRDFIPLLPTTRGARALAGMCITSNDTLVRRAGMLWGYFFPNAMYTTHLANIAEADPDPSTRKIAARLTTQLASR